MKKAKYYAERIFPYMLSLFVVIFMYCTKLNLIDSKNIDAALDGVNTMAALIIGFLGAILPVILGMKNESKFVKYVFERDEKKLFLKYIKTTILFGLLLVVMTISMYFRDIIDVGIIEKLFYLWSYLVVLFLACTYRSLSNMLNLIFSNDSTYTNDIYEENHVKTEKEKQLEEKFKV